MPARVRFSRRLESQADLGANTVIWDADIQKAILITVSDAESSLNFFKQTQKWAFHSRREINTCLQFRGGRDEAFSEREETGAEEP